ncbi:MAG TPA: T9SS type A sorting domain-containing protein [Bacteroidota bacterium]|nr:T9SS type A sorting domain-containing protein [Bacteroidota bacterium]
MKIGLTVSLLLAVLSAGRVLPQTVVHPWRVVDNGGGKSAAGGVQLQASIGQCAVQAMTSGGANAEGGYIPGLRELGGAVTTVDYLVENSWNMVSVPLLVGDFRKTSLYPGATSVAFAYEGSYARKDSLKNGVGYWIKYPAPDTLAFTGTSISRDTLDVNNNWNIIGCLSYPVRVANVVPVPPTAIGSGFFGYSMSSGYFIADTLKPGRAYWIKVRNAGKLAMSTGSASIPPTRQSAIATKSSLRATDSPDAVQNLSTLTFRDANGRERTLHFSTVTIDLDLGMFELPPQPPPEVLEVRYSTNRMLEVAERGKMREVAIRISNAGYPLTISWKCKGRASLLLDHKVILLEGSGETRVTGAETPIRLRLSPAVVADMPKTFALYQNYPNPFNPSTTIRYDLPKSVSVTLKIYNILGQEVATLADDVQEAGFKSAVWNANNIATGVYLYRLVAGTFTEVRKMMILK